MTDWVMVPREPTPEMCAAGFCVSEAEHDPAGVYRAMLSAAPQQQAEPVAYLCPAGCGCTWRDNKDGSMSLFGRNSRSCATCEFLSLSGLIPVYYPTPTASGWPTWR